MADHPIRYIATRLGVLTASPWAFVVLGLYGAIWLAVAPESHEWHAVATFITLAMTLVIQRAEHRDTQALHAKLDELLHSSQKSSNRLTHIDEREPEDIEAHRDHARAGD
ncbi:low affinity iron permease family protein [Chelatococcus reniformis]|uniref:Membrane protein n=1 Tax=Chelatococcus reniformis TaxID=1494448 RepID=A0A916U577_9HYPH|nr:low affinity iron permease family protein [Chelatococcus reniformis]GGC60640.1 membrane protein [Chelatococcus reniformis]